MKVIQSLLLFIYQVFNKTGILDSIWFKKLFKFAYFSYKKYLEDPFFSLTQQYSEMFQGGHILDVGANIGYTAAVFAKAISPGFNVYAFEPEETNFKSLENQKIENIISIQSAVGETQGTVNLWYNDNHHADHRILTPNYQKTAINLEKIFTVPICSLDYFVEYKLNKAAIKFIKIDVQGYELPVCRGMEKTLMANPNAVIAVEYMPSGMSELGFHSAELLQFFQTRNYFIYNLDRTGKLTSTDSKSIDKLVQKRGYIDLIFSKKELILKSKESTIRTTG